mgnify:CR=1 FL=1|tara:strand:+ start:443 stop:847 length:405 start_codon:yes stop_codon:yes gene_type:complete
MNLNKVKVFNLEIKKNPKGDLLKFLNKKDKHYKGFGEIYFSDIKKPHVKGWNLHKNFFCQITVCFGSVKITIKSKIGNKRKIVNLSTKKPKMIIIPPNLWFSIRSKTNYSRIVNVLNGVHNQKETLKKLIDNKT